MLAGLTFAQIALLLILAAAFVLLLTERIRVDVTAALIIIALVTTGIMEPEAALSGFGSEPAIIAAAVFVLSGGLYYTGLADKLGQLIGRAAGGGYSRIVAVMMPAVAFLSAFTHHLTMTAIMLPVTLRLSREHNVAASKLLMPMAMAASLGTTTVIIGAPAFLIADQVLRQAGSPGLSIFSIAPIGLALCLVGTLYMLVVGRFLLPDTHAAGEMEAETNLDGYYTEVVIEHDSRFVGKEMAEFEAENEARFKVANWIHHGRSQRRPFRAAPLAAGDIVLVRTTPEELATIQHEPGLALHAVHKYANQILMGNKNSEEAKPSERWLQAVIAPDSELIGRTIGQVDFLHRYGIVVVGLWRQQGWLRAELSRVRLKAGDVLVLHGSQESLSLLPHDRSFLLVMPFTSEARLRHRAPVAALVMLASILLAVFQVVPIEIAMVGGAAAMVLSRCLTADQAYDSINGRIYVFIAGVIPLGIAMEQTGTSDLLATGIQGLVSNWPPFISLMILFIGSALITQLMSDAGTTALLAPIAVALARALGQPPEPYVITIAMAAVASFLTPIGHHGNLLIYGPGGYKFSDFLKVGTPLTLLIGVLVVFISQLIWTN